MRARRAWVLAAAVVLAACGRTPADEQVLIRFFEQSRVYDRAMLAAVATVAFNPRTDGMVDRFEIVERSGEHRSGDAVVQDVTIRADVRSPRGGLQERMLVMTMARHDGRWMVTGFR